MKNGFTLSEVLITLVIIGVISAITIPQLNNNIRRKDLHSRFLKVYSGLNSFSKKFYADEGISFTEYCRTTNISEFPKKFMSYYNTSGTASKDTWNTAKEDLDNNYQLNNFSGNTKVHGYCDNTAFLADLSGTLYKFNDNPQKYNGPVVCVDINGMKGPNKIGYDYFLFVFTKDNRVIPMGMEDENNPSAGATDGSGSEFSTSCSSSNAWGCAYFALKDKNPNNESKSYWGDFI